MFTMYQKGTTHYHAYVMFIPPIRTMNSEQRHTLVGDTAWTVHAYSTGDSSSADGYREVAWTELSDLGIGIIPLRRTETVDRKCGGTPVWLEYIGACFGALRRLLACTERRPITSWSRDYPLLVTYNDTLFLRCFVSSSYRECCPVNIYKIICSAC